MSFLLATKDSGQTNATASVSTSPVHCTALDVYLWPFQIGRSVWNQARCLTPFSGISELDSAKVCPTYI